MKYKLQTYPIIAVLGLSLLCYMFFGHYQGELITHAGLYTNISIIIFFLTLYVMYRMAKNYGLKEDSEIEKRINKKIKFLKNSGKKLELKVFDTEIISRNSTSEYHDIVGKYGALDQIHNSNSRRRVTILNSSYLKYSTEINYKQHHFISKEVNATKDMLALILSEKELFIYFDPNDPEIYHFDIGI